MLINFVPENKARPSERAGKCGEEFPAASVHARCILISSKSLSTDEEDSALLIIPPECPGIQNPQSIYVTQRGNGTVAPEGQFIVHLSTCLEASSAHGEGELRSREMLRRAISRIYGASNHGSKCASEHVRVEDDPVIWSAHFSCAPCVHQRHGTEVAPGIFICGGPSALEGAAGVTIDLDFAFEAAEALFTSAYPDDEFLAERGGDGGGSHSRAGAEDDADSDMSGLEEDDDLLDGLDLDQPEV